MTEKWSKVRLGEICQTNKSTYSLSEKWDYVNYLDTGNLTQDKVTEYQHIVLGQDKLPSRARRKVDVGDILYSTVRPNQLHYGIVKNLIANTLVSTGFAVITVDKKKANSDFIYYYLTQNEVTETLQAIGEQSTSAYPSIKPSDIEKLELNLPTLEEQEVIAQTLRSLDQKIEVNREINHHLVELAVSIWQERFSSQDTNGKLGDIIELYDSKRVPLSSKQRQKMDKIYPYYGATSLMDYVDNYLFDGIYLLLGEDGTVISEEGYPILQYVWGKFWVNNHAHILVGRNGFTVESLYVLLKSTNVSSIVTGAVQLKINQANLKSVEVYIPSAEELESFNSTIEPIFDQLRNSTNEIETLTKLRDSLLPKLMSGEISVTD